MRALKIATLLLMGVTLALFVMASLGLRDAKGGSRSELVRAARRARTLSFIGTFTFLVSSGSAAYLFARAKREYRAEAKRNLEGLIEGARDDLRRRDG